MVGGMPLAFTQEDFLVKVCLHGTIHKWLFLSFACLLDSTYAG